MVLEVGLVAAVKSVVVEHGIHACIVGIVAGADGVDVVALHQQYVLQHVVSSDGAACNGVGIVAVHTLQHYTLAVDIEQGTDNLHLADTHLGGECHQVLAALVLLHDVQGVERGSLCRPEAGIGNKELGLAALEGLLCHQLTLGCVQLGHRGHVGIYTDIDNAVIAADVGLHHMVTYALLGYIIYIYAAEDTRHAEHILALQV